MRSAPMGRGYAGTLCETLRWSTGFTEDQLGVDVDDLESMGRFLYPGQEAFRGLLHYGNLGVCYVDFKTGPGENSFVAPHPFHDRGIDLLFAVVK